MNAKHLTAILALATSFSLPVQGEEKTFYRYVNEKGVKVIVDTLPPEAAPLGYDIITLTGRLIKHVPRQLTAEELADKSSELYQQRQQEQEQKRLEEWDNSLMLRYSTTADIEAAKTRALDSIKVRVGILKSNRVSVKSEIEREQARAADIERRGRQVPKAIIDKIAILQGEIEGIEQAIAQREEEVAAMAASFDRDIERFKTLEDQIELRNQTRARPSANRAYY